MLTAWTATVAHYLRNTYMVHASVKFVMAQSAASAQILRVLLATSTSVVSIVLKLVTVTNAAKLAMPRNVGLVKYPSLGVTIVG